MKTGDIVLIPFPFAELTRRKARPAVVVCETIDVYRDLVLSAISSVVPPSLNEREILLAPDHCNGLRKQSVLKIDRLVTAKKEDVIAHLGALSSADLAKFRDGFKRLAD